MARHAAPRKQHYRSPLAEEAYRAGIVSGTIDLSRPPALTVRERAMRTAARNGAVLATLAAMVWLFDFAEVIRG